MLIQYYRSPVVVREKETKNAYEGNYCYADTVRWAIFLLYLWYIKIIRLQNDIANFASYNREWIAGHAKCEYATH